MVILDSGCVSNTCGSFWKIAATVDHRNVVGDRIERHQRVGSHEEIELARDQEDAVVLVGAARYEGDVEADFS